MKPWEYRMLLPDRQAELRAIYSVKRMIADFNASEQEKIFDNMTRKAPGAT